MNIRKISWIVGAAGAAMVAGTAAQADLFTNYNLVVRSSLDSTSQVGGLTAVGGNLAGSASNYGTALTPSSAYAGANVLIVGGNLLAQNINMQAGNLRLGGTLGSTHVNQNGGGTTVMDPTAASFVTGLGGEMERASASLHTLAATNAVVLPSGQPAGVTFNAAPGADGVAVFNVTGSSIFSNGLVQQMTLAMNGATSVIINVAGSTINWTDGNMVGGLTTADARSKVLWNFYEATTVNLGGRSMNGAVLAPYASVAFEGTMEGSLWANSVTQRASVNMSPYVGVIPAPGAAALLGVAGLMGIRRRR